MRSFFTRLLSAGAFLFILLLAVSASSVFADGDQWTSHGPYGAFVYAIAVDPTNASIVHVGTGRGIYTSQDGGLTWATSQEWTAFDYITTLIIDPTSPTTLYAGDYGALLKSTDGGMTWTSKGIAGGQIVSLAIDPSAPATLYAGLQGGLHSIYKSSNGGDTWDYIWSSSYPSAVCVVVDPSTPTAVYAVMSDNWVYKSLNGGSSWSVLGNVPRAAQLVIDPATPMTMYMASSQDGIFKSVDGGITWDAASIGLGSLEVQSIAISPESSTHLCAGTTSGAFVSGDGGATWAAGGPTELALHSMYALAYGESSPGTLFGGGSGAGVFRSLDGGANWTLSSTGLMNVNVDALVGDPESPCVLYAGSYGAGVFKSPDEGLHWAPSSVGLTDLHVLSLAVDSGHPATFYAGTYSKGLFKSSNGGDTWTPLGSIPGTNWVRYVTVDPEAPYILYAVTGSSGVFKSTDSGATWQKLSVGNCNNSITIDPFDHQVLYLAGCSSVSKSSDGGSTWTGCLSGQTNTVICDPVSQGTIYACMSNAVVRKSVDGGATWAWLYPCDTEKSLVVDPLNNQILYAGGSAGSVCTSADGGGTWTLMGDNLPYFSTKAVLIVPGDSRRLFAANGGAGVYSIDLPPPCTPVSITAQPQSVTIPAGTTTTLSVTATGSGTLSYQWYEGASGNTSTPVGTNSSGFATPALTQTTSYWVRVSNGCGTPADSSTATVTVCAPVQITTPPASAAIFSGQSTTLSLVATGSGTLTHQWYQGNGGDTSTPVGTDAASFTTPALAQTTSYWVRVSNGCGTPADSATATVTVCTLSCTASASPASGMAPLDVSFSASFQLNGGCELAYTDSFDFGDGTPPAAYVGEHTYVNPGIYTWTYTVAVLGGTTCTRTGTVTVCGLACGATVPAKATVGLAAAFAGSASVTGGCASAITYDWNFGDGTAHSSAQNPSHTFASAGAYTWTLTVSAGGASCTKTGAITMVNPPVITLMKKVAPPFKIVVTGTNLQSGIRVFIDGAEWTSVMVKESTKIQLTGGASLKAVVPKGVPKTFRLLNPDGGEATTTWSW